MKTVSKWQATYTPGRWVVLAGPTAVVVMEPVPVHMSGQLTDLWLDVAVASDINELAQKLSAFLPDSNGPFAVLFWAGEGMRSLIRGDLRIVDAETGNVVADGEGFHTWNEAGLQSVRQVRVQLDDSGDEAELRLPLVVGVVLASEVTIDSTQKVALVLPTVASAVGEGGPFEKTLGDSVDGLLGNPGMEQEDGAHFSQQSEPVLPESTEPSVATEDFDDDDDDYGQTVFVDPTSRVPTYHFGHPAHDVWGIRDGEPVAPVALSVDEDGDGIPDAQQQDLNLGTTSAVAPAVPVALDVATPEELQSPVSGGHVPSQDPYSPSSQASPYDQQLPGHPTAFQPHQAQPFQGNATQRVPVPARPVSTAYSPVQPTPAMHSTRQPVPAQPRSVQSEPGIAQLITSNGAWVDVIGTVIIGRAPSTQPGDINPVLFTVPSPNSDISRTHLKVVASGSDIVVTDLRSTNGTLLVWPGQRPVRMNPGVPVTVEPGTILDLGDGCVITVVTSA